MRKGLEATGQGLLGRCIDGQLLADCLGQGEGAGAGVLVFPEPQEASLQIIDGLGTTRLPGAEGLDGFEVAGPAVGRFVDAAAEAQSLPVLVFDHAFLGMEDGAVVDDPPVDEGQPHPDLQVPTAHQPGQELGPEGCGPLTARLHSLEGEVVREVIGENGSSRGSSRQGGRCRPR